MYVYILCIYENNLRRKLWRFFSVVTQPKFVLAPSLFASAAGNEIGGGGYCTRFVGQIVRIKYAKIWRNMSQLRMVVVIELLPYLVWM